MGSGSECRFSLGSTLGTGIGCAWINGGKVWRGHSGCAGEVWTSPYKEGILEDYVSGNAVTRLYKEYTKEELPAYRIAELARSGDKMALQVLGCFCPGISSCFVMDSEYYRSRNCHHRRICSEIFRFILGQGRVAIS